jgi:hypothetical protein
MFIDCKYKTWYFNIIETAKNRELHQPELVEEHHIIPKCMGGKDLSDNLVKLSPREHFICHWILIKIVSDPKHARNLRYALHTFFHFNKFRKLNFTSRQYAEHSRQFRSSCMGRVQSVKPNKFLFKNLTTQTEFEGTIYEFRQHSNLSAQNINWLTRYCIDTNAHHKTIKNWSIWIEELQLFSHEKPRKKSGVENLNDVTCEYCKKTISCGNYYRWHGNKCSQKDPIGHYERTRQVAGINKR